MKKVFALLFFLVACSVQEKKRPGPFPVLTITENEWATYEGRWVTEDGILTFELSLKSGTIGVDSYYRLIESIISVPGSIASAPGFRLSGLPSQGLYSSYNGFENKELGICLHDLFTFYSKTRPSKHFPSTHFRYKKKANGRDEMFFMTRGNDELLPCDDSFKPITTDRRYTLHKRSKLFTVEGYITFERDSAEFFERNTWETWKVADLGEYNELRLKYKKLAKIRHQGIYLKALAYSVLDSSQRERKALVIKRTKSVGKDPD